MIITENMFALCGETRFAHISLDVGLHIYLHPNKKWHNDTNSTSIISQNKNDPDVQITQNISGSKYLF